MSTPSQQEKRERKAWLLAFGQAVQARRASSGLTQEQLAYRTGLDQTYVSGVERGRRNPTVLVVWRLASGLGTSLNDLLQTAEKIENGTYVPVNDKDSA